MKRKPIDYIPKEKPGIPTALFESEFFLNLLNRLNLNFPIFAR